VICTNKLSETAAVSESLYELFECVRKSTLHIDRLNFFKQLLDEFKRISVKRESPEIIAIIADWGQGKSAFLDIIQEYSKSLGKAIYRWDFLSLINQYNFDFYLNNYIYLIDEVESVIDNAVKDEYKDRIKDFWLKLKLFANSKGDSIIYLSMTPSAYNKIFSLGGILNSLFNETFQSIRERIKIINISNPTKLEFMSIYYCLFKKNGIIDLDFIRHLDFIYWISRPDRRRYIRFFNEIICKTYPDLEETFNEVIRGKLDINDEKELVNKSKLIKLENLINKSELPKLHKMLMSRIFTEEPLDILKDKVVRGKLVPFNKWLEISTSFNISNWIDNFLLTLTSSSVNSFDDNIYVFVSKDISKILPDIDYREKEKLSEIISKIINNSEKDAYALEWSFYSEIFNTNIEDYILEFRNDEALERARKFVNDNLLEVEKELDSIVSLLRKLLGELEVIALNNYIREIRKDKIRIILAKPTNLKELYELRKLILSSKFIIHGIILVNSDFLEQNSNDVSKIKELADNLSILLKLLTISTLKKRHLLYLLFAEIFPEKAKIKENKFISSLIDVIKEIQEYFQDIYNKVNISQLPIIKGSKKLDTSINWILYYPAVNIVNIDEIFNRVNYIINNNFRIYGQKQFKLEDFETSKILKEEILPYLRVNQILKINNENIIDFEDFVGNRVKEFSRHFAGYLKQVFKDNSEKVIFNYILYLSELSNEKTSKVIEDIAAQIYGKNATVDFMLYISFLTGEIIKYFNYKNIINLILNKLNEINNEINFSINNFNYFLTVKKRDIAIRNINDMKRILLLYKENIEKSILAEDINNIIRLSIVFFNLFAIYKDLINAAIKSKEEFEKIVEKIEKKIKYLNEIKAFLGINEELVEIDIITKIIERINNIEVNITKIIERINNFNEYDIENFRKLLNKMGVEDYVNLNLFLIKVLDKTLEGERIEILEILRDTILYDITVLNEIGFKITRIISLYDTIKNENPKIIEVTKVIEDKKKRIIELVNTIHTMVEKIEC
jgi:hypothetical protein